MLGLFNRPPKGVLRSLFKLRRRHGLGKRLPGPAEVSRLMLDPDIRWSDSVDVGSALLEAGRFEEADAVIESGLFSFPDDPSLRVRHALSANNSGRYRIAIARWEAALAVAPERSICRIGLAANFREIGDFGTARRWITGALQLWPEDEGVIGEAARIAEMDGRIAESVQLWAKLIETGNPRPESLRGHAHCLMLLGRLDEAEAAIADALGLYPTDHRLLGVEAMIAAANEDWTKAVELWSEYRRRFPDDPTGWEHYERVIAKGRAADTDQGNREESEHLLTPEDPLIPVSTNVSVLPAPEIQDDAATRDLLLGFENIGENCEFGFVQRRYGAEPPGLLRWSDVAFGNLLFALDYRFEGMGDVKQTELPVLDDGEFVVRDSRWDLSLHTFLFRGQADLESRHVDICRHVADLRDRFFADLAEAEKVFVFCSAGLDGDQIEALHQALWVYGPVRLLVVQPVGAPTGFHGEPGQVVTIDERRHVGFLRRLGVADGHRWDIAFEDWIAICRATAA